MKRFFETSQDKKAFGIFIGVGLPFVISKALLTSFSTLCMTASAALGFEKVFNVFRKTTYNISDTISTIERFAIHTVSYYITGSEEAFLRYEENLPILYALEKLDIDCFEKT